MHNVVDFDKISEEIGGLSDEAVRRLQFSTSWQYSPDSTAVTTGSDGQPLYPQTDSEEGLYTTRQELQTACWNKFNLNPQVNTAIRGQVGRIAGRGFEVTSEKMEIQNALDEIHYDPRNRLYNYWPKYIGRSLIEGELFICFTCHKSGFIEVDFIDPTTLDSGGDGDTGIIFHPSKTNMPLFYNVSLDPKNPGEYEQIPSVFIARYPELIKVAKKHSDYKVSYQKNSRSRAKVYEKLGGFYRFIVSWDKGFITKRSTSYLKTTIQWLNYYEMLKKYEIDHKRSVGSYVWVFTIENPKDFRLWLAMTDEQREKTGISAKKTPGSTLVLPPGVTLEVKSPQLPQIKDEDTDIMGMAVSGLNEPEDVTMGTSRSSYSSVKASRGPMSDRTSDEIEFFDRFLKYDFFGSIFFLKSVLTDFPKTFKSREAVAFKSKGEGEEAEAIFENVRRRPEELIDTTYPTSETIDFDSRTKGLLGSKHGPVTDTLGIPRAPIAERLGFGSYGRNRLRKATEDENYPELIYALDAESLQEKAEAEPGKDKKDKKIEKKSPKE